jgi:hypothetical protein
MDKAVVYPVSGAHSKDAVRSRLLIKPKHWRYYA